LQNLDLNLLKVFMALYEERNVTSAGDRLGLAQSSVSHALTRLRHTLDDPLFVRDVNGMQPTALAIRMAGPIQTALATIRTAISDAQDFDPASSEREFNLMTSDMGELSFLPRLMRHLAENAPGIKIRMHHRPRSDYRVALESGEMDVALGQLPNFNSGLYHQRLSRQELIFAVRKGHPIGDTLTVETLLQADHLIVGRGMIETRVSKALGRRAAERNVTLQLDHYLTAPHILLNTNLIAALPRSLVEAWPGLQILPVPFDIDPIELVQFWHRRSHEDPACRWMRKTIYGLFRKD